MKAGTGGAASAGGCGEGGGAHCLVRPLVESLDLVGSVPDDGFAFPHAVGGRQRAAGGEIAWVGHHAPEIVSRLAQPRLGHLAG